MKVTVNQRCVLLVIVAMILIMALLRGIPQSTKVEMAKNPSLSTMHIDTKPLELEKSEDSTQTSLRINSATAEIANHLEGIGKP